jgi:hypothetical protein
MSRGRRSIRLPGYDYASAGGYFVTIATYKQTALLGRIIDDAVELNSLGKVAQKYWQEIPAHFSRVEIDSFIVVPNHLHGILLIHWENTSTRVGAQHAAPLPARSLESSPRIAGCDHSLLQIRSYQSGQAAKWPIKLCNLAT